MKYIWDGIYQTFRRADDVAAMNEKWITVHPNGPDNKGRPALIDDDGTVKGGMGGKFNGRHIKDARKGAEDASENSPSSQSKSDKASAIREFKKLNYENLAYRHIDESSKIPSDPTWKKIHEGVLADKKRMKELSEKYPEVKIYSEINGIEMDYMVSGRGEKILSARKLLREGGSAEEAKRILQDGMIDGGVAKKKITMNVPYDEKDMVKSEGARWDSGIKKWYIPEGSKILEKFHKYLPSYMIP